MLLHPRSLAGAAGALLLVLLTGVGCKKSATKDDKDKTGTDADKSAQVCTGVKRCDAGQMMACGGLNGAAGGTWKSNKKLAICRSDCSGWDVGSCNVADDKGWELVRPASRAPDLSTSKAALCNDGSEFGFYVQIRNPKSKRWMIALEGGGECDHVGDPKVGDCNQREADRVAGVWEGTDFAPDGETKLGPGKDGLLSADATKNPAFADYNKAFGVYCSSDLWTGGSTTLAQLPGGAVQFKEPRKGVTGPIQFHGADNFDAMVELLIQRYGLADTSATEILLVGGSAGGHGVYANASVLAAKLPTISGKGHLRVVADGAFSPVPWVRDVKDPNTTNVSVLTGDRAASVWNVETCPKGTAICDQPLHPACLADPKNSNAEGACYLGAPALTWLTTGGSGVPALPTMIVSYQLDTVQYGLQTAGQGKWPDRAKAWRDDVTALLTNANPTWPLPASAWVFAPCGPAPSGTPPTEDYHTEIWKDPTKNTMPTIGGASVYDQLACFVAPTSACVPVRVESPCP